MISIRSCRRTKPWLTVILIAMMASLGATPSWGQNLLQNPGFEAAPPNKFGNNIDHPIPGWVIGDGDRTNVVRVINDPSIFDYRRPDGFLSGPNRDAQNDGQGAAPGTPQHYLDIVGVNSLYQVFTTPSCDTDPNADVIWRVSGWVSYRDNLVGGAVLRVREGAGLAGAAVTPAAGAVLDVTIHNAGVTPPAGSPNPQQIGPNDWFQVTGDFLLDQGSTYTFEVELDNNANFDEGSVIEVFGCPRPAITLDKVITAGSPYTAAGNQITYSLTAVNTGNVALLNVEIADPVASLGTCTPTQPATLQPDETLTCPATYTVQQADVDAGQFVNTATVSGVDADGRNVSDTAQAIAVDPDAQASLTLSKVITEGAAYARVGDIVHYQLTATNAGDVSLLGMAISDPQAVIGDCVPTQPVKRLPGETLVCLAHYTITQVDINQGSFTNTATVTATGPQGAPLEAQAQATATGPAAEPAITLVKTASTGASAIPGGLIRYTLTATNVGNVGLGQVDIIDDLIDLSCERQPPVALPPNSSLTCVGSYQTALSDNETTIVNTGSASGQTLVGQSVSATDQAVVTVRLPTEVPVNHTWLLLMLGMLLWLIAAACLKARSRRLT